MEVLDSARSMWAIEDNIACASLDTALHGLVLDPVAREQLRQQLVVVWFGSFAQPLDVLFEEERWIDDAEIALRGRVAGKAVAPSEPATDPARSAAFRRIVTEAYDYRCAASGCGSSCRTAPSARPPSPLHREIRGQQLDGWAGRT